MRHHKTICRGKRWLWGALLFGAFWTAGAEAELLVRGQVVKADGGPWPRVAVALIAAGDPYATALERLGGRAYPQAAATGETGAWGEFILEVPAPGLWQVLVTAPGAVPMLHDPLPVVEDILLPPLTPPTDIGLEIQTQPGGVDVRLRPPGLAWVPEEPQWRAAQQMGRSDAEGRLRLPRGAGEDLEVVATRPGWKGIRVPAASGRKAVSLSLEKSQSCRFSIGHRGGGPATGVLVAGDGILEGLVDGEGWAELPRIVSTTDLLTPEGLAWRLPVGCDSSTATVIPPPQWIEGQVVNRASGDPVAEALVWNRHGRATQTDRRGRFRLATSGLEAHRLHAAAADFQPLRMEVAADATTADLRLPPAFTLRGWVEDVGGSPLLGAQVAVRAAWRSGSRWEVYGGRDPRPAESWFDGSFFLPLPWRNQGWELRVNHEGFAPDRRYVPTGSEPVVVSLTVGTQVFGEVVDPADEPVEAAQVQFFRVQSGVTVAADQPPEFTAVSAPDGTFSMPHLSSGTFDVAVTAAGFATTELPGLEVAEGAAEVDLGIVVLEPGVRVEGRVEDAAGTPVVGAEVVANVGAGGTPETTVTDPRGRFALRDLRRGERLTLWVTHPDYVAASVPGVEAPTRDPLLVILRNGGRIFGRVVDEVGQPLAFAMVTASQGDRGPGRSGVDWRLRKQNQTTAEDGSFTFGGLTEGLWQIEAQRPRFLRTAPVPVDLGAGGEVGPLEIVLGRGATLRGQVRTAEGGPAAGADISYQVQSRGIGYNDKVDREGRFEFSGLEVGPVEISAAHPDQGKTTRWVEIHPGVNEVDLRLERRPGIAGRVEDPQGEPFVEAQVSLRSDRWERQKEVSHDGTFRFPNLEPGPYTVTAFGGGYAASEPQALTLDQQSVDGLVLRLRRGTALTGTLHGLTLEQLNRVQIAAVRTGERFGRNLAAQVDLDARYRMEGLTPGDWRVVARVEGGPMEREEVRLEAGDGERVVDFHFEGDSEFRVRVLHNGEPMVGASVHLRGEQQTAGASTNHQGVAKIEGLSAGEYQMVVGLSWGSFARPVVIWDGGEELVEIDSGRLEGTVHAANDGAPLAAVIFRASPVDPALSWPAGRSTEFRSDAGGFFNQTLRPGGYRVLANLEGYAVEQLEVEISSRGLTPVRFELRSTGTLEFLVRHASGVVPDYLTLYGLDSNGNRLFQESLRPQGPDGRFRLTNPPTEARVIAYADGAAFVTLPPGQLRDGATVVLPPGSTLQLSAPVLGERPVPIDPSQAAQLILTDAGGAPFSPRLLGLGGDSWPVSTNQLRVPGLNAGVWAYRLVAPDGRSWEGSFNAFPGQRVEVVIE